MQQHKDQNAAKTILSEIFAYTIKLIQCNLMELREILYDFKNKINSRTYKHSNQKGTVFQGFKGLEKALMNFKYLNFKDLCERSLLKRKRSFNAIPDYGAVVL